MRNNITFLLSQKIKQPFYKESLSYYESKLQPYCHFEVVEAKSDAQLEKLYEKYNKTHYAIALDESGRQFDSVSFAKRWDEKITSLSKNICFLVGGPYGFSSMPKTQLTLSLSDFTLNHEMVPVILLEQIYRAYSIAKGLPYHHA